MFKRGVASHRAAVPPTMRAGRLRCKAADEADLLDASCAVCAPTLLRSEPEIAVSLHLFRAPVHSRLRSQRRVPFSAPRPRQTITLDKGPETSLRTSTRRGQRAHRQTFSLR